MEKSRGMSKKENDWERIEKENEILSHSGKGNKSSLTNHEIQAKKMTMPKNDNAIRINAT